MPALKKVKKLPPGTARRHDVVADARSHGVLGVVVAVDYQPGKFAANVRL
ncbi:MAG TPA: hypothetical protein VFR12_04365 [Pyrinomonadaceae bacterium]|nr:hypothetical protein [Pyrinomonadaceae bacterium]